MGSVSDVELEAKKLIEEINKKHSTVEYEELAIVLQDLLDL